MSATGEGHTATINAPTRSWQAQTTGTSRGTASQLPALGSERQTPPADPASWWPRSERVKTNTKNVRVTADSRGKPQRAALLKPSSITDESGTSRHARSYLSAQSASCSVYHVRQHAEGSELVKYCTAATSYASTAGRLPTATSPSGGTGNGDVDAGVSASAAAGTEGVGTAAGLGMGDNRILALAASCAKVNTGLTPSRAVIESDKPAGDCACAPSTMALATGRSSTARRSIKTVVCKEQQSQQDVIKQNYSR